LASPTCELQTGLTVNIKCYKLTANDLLFSLRIDSKSLIVVDMPLFWKNKFVGNINDSLHDNALKQVFKWLTVDQKISVRRVCKRWKS
jgi:hypothetical protein